MRGAIQKHLRHHEDWRALTTINAYRSLIAISLAAMHFSPWLRPLLDIHWVPLFELVSLGYLLSCALAVTCTALRRPELRIQVALFCVLDVVFLAALVFAGSGVASGLGGLVIVPVACASALLSTRMAFFMAALATTALLFPEFLRPTLLGAGDSALIQAGILGLLCFVVAALAQWLARRIRANQAMIAAHSGTVRNLTALNQRIIEQMDTGAVAVDGRHRLQLTNAAAVRLLGLAQAPATGTPLHVASPALNDALMQWLQAPGQPPASFAPGGRTLRPRFSILPTFAHDTTGRATPILIFLEDTQRQHEQAQQLKLAALGQLSASIAHEIRNPLSAITHATQLLAESEALSPEDHKLLDIVQRHGQRIDRIVEDVMGLSRHNTHALPFIHLHTWLQQSLAEYRQLRDAPPEFNLAAMDVTPSVRFNPAHLRRILFNLWQNAEHHARRSDTALRVFLDVTHDDQGHLCLDSTDNGPGMDSDTLDRILEPFYTTSSDGTGLGLHLARELCDANHARLIPLATVRGACFRIQFAAADNTPHD